MASDLRAESEDGELLVGLVDKEVLGNSTVQLVLLELGTKVGERETSLLSDWVLDLCGELKGDFLALGNNRVDLLVDLLFEFFALLSGASVDLVDRSYSFVVELADLSGISYIFGMQGNSEVVESLLLAEFSLTHLEGDFCQGEVLSIEMPGRMSGVNVSFAGKVEGSLLDIKLFSEVVDSATHLDSVHVHVQIDEQCGHRSDWDIRIQRADPFEVKVIGEVDGVEPPRRNPLRSIVKGGVNCVGRDLYVVDVDVHHFFTEFYAECKI